MVLTQLSVCHWHSSSPTDNVHASVGQFYRCLEREIPNSLATTASLLAVTTTADYKETERKRKRKRGAPFIHYELDDG